MFELINVSSGSNLSSVWPSLPGAEVAILGVVGTVADVAGVHKVEDEAPNQLLIQETTTLSIVAVTSAGVAQVAEAVAGNPK